MEYRGIEYDFVGTTGTFFPPYTDKGFGVLIAKREGWSFKACAERSIDDYLDEYDI